MHNDITTLLLEIQDRKVTGAEADHGESRTCLRVYKNRFRVLAGSVDFSKRKGTHNKIKTVKSVSFSNETTFHLFKRPVMSGF